MSVVLLEHRSLLQWEISSTHGPVLKRWSHVWNVIGPSARNKHIVLQFWINCCPPGWPWTDLMYWMSTIFDETIFKSYIIHIDDHSSTWTEQTEKDSIQFEMVSNAQKMYWSDSSVAQNQGLEFWETVNNAIILCDTTLADCLRKGVKRKLDDTEAETLKKKENLNKVKVIA